MIQYFPKEILLFIINNKLGLTISIENKKIIDSSKYIRLLFEKSWTNSVESKHKLENKIKYNKYGTI